MNNAAALGEIDFEPAKKNWFILLLSNSSLKEQGAFLPDVIKSKLVLPKIPLAEAFRENRILLILDNLAEEAPLYSPVGPLGQAIYTYRTYTKGTIESNVKREEEFRHNLIDSLKEEPIEDGCPHPAEEIIKSTLLKYKAAAIDWIQSVYLKSIMQRTIAAGILRCIGRLSYEKTKPWGLALTISGLSHPHVEVREAAVRALEMWGGQESLEVLKDFENIESVRWLKAYIKQVVADLSK
jgi:hypothetical protein